MHLDHAMCLSAPSRRCTTSMQPDVRKSTVALIKLHIRYQIMKVNN